MKKLLIASLLVIGGTKVMAQKLDGVTKYLVFHKYEDAKKELDKVMADPKAKETDEVLLLRLKINSELALDSAASKKYPDAMKDAYTAYSKYRQSDTALKALTGKDRDNDALRAVTIIYSSYFNAGHGLFKESKWNEALDKFKVSEDIGEMLSKKGLTNNKQNIDTFSVLFAGYAAQNAQKADDAVFYYKKIAAEKIGGQDYMDVYRYLLNYYSDKKDDANFQKYLALAKALYPDKASMWEQYGMEFKNSNSSLDQMIASYKSEDAGGALTGGQYSNYGEYFANPNKDEVAKLDSTKQAEIRKYAADAFKKAYDKDQSNPIIAFNAGVMFYNEFNILDQRYSDLRGQSAQLKAQRDEVVKQQYVQADDAIKYLTSAYDALKAKATRTKNENNCLSRAVDWLANLYSWKRDKARGVKPQDVDKYDALYKQFDAEHGKY
ncbi:MAG: hypothetical protein J0I41_14610 [Filimonas sp.]|nr:hypothetical protein [Filimonas sp.]